MMAFLADASGSFNTFLKQMEEKSSDAMTKQLLEASMDTYQTRMAQAQAAFQSFGVTIGNMVLPVLKDMALLMTGLGQYLQEHAQQILGVVSVLGKLALGFIAVKTAMMIWAGVTSIVTGIATAINAVKLAFQGVALAEGASALATTAYTVAKTIQKGIFWIATTAMLAYTAATEASSIAEGIAAGATVLLSGAVTVLETVLAPLTLTVLAVVAAIAALGVIAYEVYQNWETVSNELTYIWNTLVEVISTAIEVIIIALSPFIVAMYALLQVIEFVIKEGIVPLFKWLGEIIQAVITAIGEWLKAHGVTVQNIANHIRFIWNNFVQWLANSISPAFAQWLNDMVDKLVAFANKVRSIANDVKNSIRSMFGMAQTAGESSGGFIDDIANGIKSKLNFDLLDIINQAQADMMNAPYANAPDIPAGTMPNAIPAGGSGSKGKGGKGGKGAKEADNSLEAILYRFLTKEKKESHNRAVGELAAIQSMSGFNYKAGEGTDRRGLYGWDKEQWAKYEKWLEGTGYKDSAVSQINYQHTYAQKYDQQEKEKYRDYLKSNSVTANDFAQAFSQYITKGGAIDSGIVASLDKRFSKKNGEENYDDPMKALAERYKDLKSEYDREINDLKTQRGKIGQTVSPEEQKKIFESMMGISEGKNPFAYLDDAMKDYEKVLLEAAKYEAKRQENIKSATEKQVSAIDKMADAEVAFAQKIGLMSKADVRKYNYDKNERNYATKKPILDNMLANTVDPSKGSVDEMMEAYNGLIWARNEAEAKSYANKIMWLSRDVDATKKALDEEMKLEESYQQKRQELAREAYQEKAKYVLGFIDSFSNAFQSSLESILNRTKSFGEALRDMMKSIVNDIIKLFTQDLAEKVKGWLSKLLQPTKDTGLGLGTNPSRGKKSSGGGLFGSLFGGGKSKKKGKGGSGALDIVGWAQQSLSSLNVGKGGKGGKGNIFIKALGLDNFASKVKQAVQPGLIALRSQAQMTINGLTNISQQGMQTISGGIQTGTQAMTMTWQGMEVSKQIATETGNAAIVASSETTAATVQATTAQMMGWIMAVLALFSLFGGGGGSSTSESTSSVNLGRSPDSYYMTPTPVLQSTTFNVPSFDIGGNIEQDMFAMVHKGEMVLTPEQADVIRSTARSGYNMGNGSNTNANVKSNIQVSTVDSRGFERVLRDYNRDLSKQVKKGIRNGYLTAKGLV